MVRTSRGEALWVSFAFDCNTQTDSCRGQQQQHQPIQAPQPRHAYNPAPTLDWPPIADDSWNTLFGANAPPPSLPPPLLPPNNNNAMFNPFSSTGQPNSYALSPQMQAMYPILPAFHSSYGSYNVVQGPYSRFLTPSPEPSLMGSLGMAELNDGFRDAERGGEVTFESIWRDFEERGGRERTTDPFEGLVIAGRSGETSPRPAAGRPVFEIEEDEMARLERRLEGDQVYEQRTTADCPPQPPTLALPQNAYTQQQAYDPRSLQYRYPLVYPGSFKSGQQPSPQLPIYDPPHFRSQQPSSNESSPYDAVDPSRALDWSAQATHLESVEAGPSTSSAGAPTKPVKRKRKPKEKAAAAVGPAAQRKNRNPHATQVPGTGSRQEPKVEASEDHEGPSCSHCASIVTPLWRRGPADELLCNACVFCRLAVVEEELIVFWVCADADCTSSCMASLDPRASRSRRSAREGGRRRVRLRRLLRPRRRQRVTTALRRLRRCGGRTPRASCSATPAVSTVSCFLRFVLWRN